MANNKSWDLFLSYNWGKDKNTIENVRQIHARLKQELNLYIWWDQTYLYQGNWVEKVTNGVKNSALFISFITRDYSESPNCMRELEMANNLKKEIMLFINEDTENMSHLEIINDIFKHALFYLGSNMYYKTPDALVLAIKAKLELMVRIIILNLTTNANISSIMTVVRIFVTI